MVMFFGDFFQFDCFAILKPGARDVELDAAKAEIARLSETRRSRRYQEGNMASLRQLSILLAVLGSGWFLGCASRPEEAIREAQQAMDEARAVQAPNFAPGDWKSAQDAWDAAQAALAKQSYGQASSHLMQAKSRFEKARNIARAKRDDVKKEVGTLQSAVNKRFSAAKDLFASGKIGLFTNNKRCGSCNNECTIQNGEPNCVGGVCSPRGTV